MSLQAEQRGVAVIGMGCISAAGMDVEGHWQSLEKGLVHCLATPPWLFQTKLDFPVFAGPEKGLTEKGQALLAEVAPEMAQNAVSRTVLLALSALAEALRAADIDLDFLKKQTVGIVLGTTVGCTFHNEGYYDAWRKGEQPDLSPVRFYLGGNTAAALHRILGTRGPSAVITNACASGTDAIGVAKNWIASGQCDLAIAGGADELSRVAYNGFASLLLASERPCRPFDRERKGLNLGEGAGILVLESDASARKRSVSPSGWIRGYGSAIDAWHPTAPHPEGRGLQKALKGALQDGGVDSRHISLINAHGTGTKANDLAETSALSHFFSKSAAVPVVSTKGITGHTLGAAGAIEAVFTLRALKAGRTPGTVGCLHPDHDLTFPVLSQERSEKLRGRVGISQSLAFGGGNSVLVLEAA